MRPHATRPTSSDPWAPYVPDEAMPWDLRRVVHLHRRAGFAATWDEIQRDLKDGPEASIDRLLEGKARARGVPDGFRRVRRPPGRPGAGRARAQSPQGLVGLPHALRPGPADRAADADVARPLRHQQPQGQRPGADAPAERDAALARPRPRSAGCCTRCSATRRCWSGSTPRRTPRGTQREPRPRADGAVHARHRPLFRGRRQAGRPRPDGLEARGRRSPVRPGRGTTRGPRRSSAARPRSTPTGWPGCSSSIPRRPAGWPGGSATSSSAKGPSTRLRSTRWPRDCGRTTWTSAGASRRCSARDCSSTAPTWAGASRARSSTPWARCGPSRCSTRRRARRCWPTGAGGWARTCSIRPTSAAGPAAGPGSRPARRSAGRTSPRPWSTASRSAWARRSTRSPWPSGMASGGTRRSSRNCCSAPTASRSRSMRWDRPGRPSLDYWRRPTAQRI